MFEECICKVLLSKATSLFESNPIQVISFSMLISVSNGIRFHRYILHKRFDKFELRNGLKYISKINLQKHHLQCFCNLHIVCIKQAALRPLIERVGLTSEFVYLPLFFL